MSAVWHTCIIILIFLEVWFQFILLCSTLCASEAMAKLSQDKECRRAFDNRDHTTALELLQAHTEVSKVPHLVVLAIVNDWIDIVKLLITQYGYDPQHYQHALGITALHYAAMHGCLDIVQYLHEECDCSIGTTNNDGATTLHFAASQGHLNVVQYLVGCGANTIATDNFGATPLQRACQDNDANNNVPVIKYLLSIPAVLDYYTKESSCSSPLSGGAENETAAVYERVQVPHHVGSFVNIFLLGDSGAGKTTLCQAIKDRFHVNIETDGEFVQGVKQCTVGIVPNKFRNDKSLGNVVIRDFAGQTEYYSSHVAVIENLVQSSGAVFVIVINLTQDLSHQVRFWSSIFINEHQQNLSSECHLIVIASHADKVREGLDRRVHQLKGNISKELADVACSIYPLDCCLRSWDNLQPFTKSLSHCCASIRNKQQAVNLYCIFLYYILEEEISDEKVCCTLEELMLLCSQSRQEDIPLPDDIVPLLKTLHSQSDAGIIYLENKKELAKSWIVFSKEVLLTKVNGVLFAPLSFVEHRDIASNTGIITSSALQELFPQYSLDMLIGFLKSMKLCEELNKTLLNVPRTNLALRKENSLLDSDQLLFFPTLINEKRPQDIGGKFKVGWCLKFTSGYSFSIRFLHMILLHIAYRFSEADTTCKASWVLSGLERCCSVWTTGIHLVNDDGIETVIEQVEGNQCVMMLMSCEEGAEEDMIWLHCELIKTILCLQQES